jgi:hypothetical protein
MKSIIYKLAVVLTLTGAAWNINAQVIVGYSDLFTFDTRLTHVQGTITEEGTGNAIAGAIVHLGTHSTTSLANGSYSCDSVPAGNCILFVFKPGYVEYNQNVLITGSPSQTINISLTPGEGNYVIINDSLVAFADNISENPTNVYTLSGNVQINDVLYFDGNLEIDVRPNLTYPEISGNCGLYAKNIGSFPTYWIKNDNIQFMYYAIDKSLSPQQYAYILDGTFKIGGFNITVGEIIIDPMFDYVEIKSIAKMPFPIDKIVDSLMKKYKDDIPFFVKEFSGSRILSKTNGLQTAVDINGITVNIGFVSLEDVHLYWNTNTQTYGGGFKLNIPAEEASKRFKSDSTFSDSESGQIPVEIRDENNQVFDSLSFNKFIETYGDRGFKLLSLGAEIEFVHGDINKIIVFIGTKIPLGTTGLFLTEIGGGLEDLATENWKIRAWVDIELGYEVPVLGAPVKLNDFGVLIQPWETFRGGGEFQVFNQTVSDGYIEYNRPLNSLLAECTLNLGGIMTGNTNMSLVGGQVNGSGLLSIHTPGRSSLPWYLKWAANKNIGSAQSDLNNNYFQSSVSLGWINLAHKLKFGKQGFPWFHYYLGKNLNSLHQIWKGELDGMRGITFTVPENSKQLLVVAADTLNPTLFDFTLKDPSGHIFNKDNAHYYEANDTNKETLMSILNPIKGEWNLLMFYGGQVELEVFITNQEPTLLASQPSGIRTRSNDISLSFNDYADTLNVQVYYNKSRKHFDGSFINEFRIINNGKLDFTWQNQNVPNGEYYIYCRIDDGSNSPYFQYAPGSIWVENQQGIELPKNFAVVQENNTFLANWDEPVSESIIATTVYYKNISTGRIADETVYKSNSLTIIDLKPGQEYQLWACFINKNGSFSQPGEKINIIFTSSERNNPPYFTLDPDSIFFFVEGQQGQYELAANDADGDLLTYNIPNDTLGLILNNGQLIWTPANNDRGVYDLMITVTDGSGIDTTYQQLVVYTPDQVSVNLTFSSVNLYESDNMFVKLNNRFCPDFYQQVTLKNTRTQEETNIEIRRVNDFEYIGQFGLSFINRSDISVANGDTIEAKYIYQKQEYLAYSYYDSLPQPSDIIPPGIINDLSIEQLPNNIIKLKWSATGNDADIGKAYAYDIRYGYQTINSEEVYLTAIRIFNSPYPSTAGVKDSLIINLINLPEITQHEYIHFSIKAVDEMQNRSGLSNSAGILNPLGPESIIDISSQCGQLFKLYPNPSFGFFTLELINTDEKDDIQVEIYGPMGEMLLRTELAGQNLYDFDLSARPVGVYLIKVNKGNEQGVLKVIRN